MKRSPPPARRTPLARSALKATRKPVAALSARRASEVERRAEVVAEVRRRDRVCQAGAVHALAGPLEARVSCGGRLDVHEIVPRSAWARGYLDPANCVLICRNAHRWVGDHPHGAHALGLHGYSWERPGPDLIG